MTSDSMTRFSDEELDKCHSWPLPDVSSDSAILSVEVEARERKKKQQSLKEYFLIE